MPDLFDHLLLRRGVPDDDRTLTFRRIDGNPQSRVVYFLPWHTPFGIARQAGFIALDFLAAYEMPPAIVSSDPAFSVQALHGLVDDAEALLRQQAIAPKDAVLVGLSVGSYPATYLANRIGARLCAVAPADRADMMIWQSPAARIIKNRAVKNGFRLADYSRAMIAYHPAHNLAGVSPDSMFVFGRNDPFVPPRRSSNLLKAIGTHVPAARIVNLDAGHFRTLMLSNKHQRAMLGLEPSQSRWQMRMPLDLTFARPSAPGAQAE